MEFTTGVIAQMAGGTVEGNPDAKLTGFAKIEEAQEGDLTFLANPKYNHCLATSKATAVLVSKDFDIKAPENVTLIRVRDPYATLADLMNLISNAKPAPHGIEQPCFIAEGVEVPDDCYVGAFSYIGKGAKIGEGCQIYPQVYIGENVTVGKGSILYPGVKIYNDCQVGSHCILHGGVVIGADGFGFAPKSDGYEKIPQLGNVIIEDKVEIGANSTVDRATFGSTVVGEGTKLDDLIMVAHNVRIGKHNVMAAQVGIAGSTKIGDWNRVGGQVGFAGHISIGDRNEFGAQSGIPHSVKNGERLIGYPAVEFKQFAKNLVYLRKLGDLFNKK